MALPPTTRLLEATAIDPSKDPSYSRNPHTSERAILRYLERIRSSSPSRRGCTAGASGGAGPQSTKGYSRPSRHLYRRRSEGERFYSRLKARLRRALRYQLVESADAFVKWLSLALNVERIATGKAGT
ncbi:MAG: hypothetical protein ACTSXX_08410 [Candidatus Baldrarchaeia archaeon]